MKTDETALIVVDVQDGIANDTSGVPDAAQVKHAINSILKSVRQHNSNAEKSAMKIILVQHDDRDPEDPLYRGKPTWNLVFSPQPDAANEMLVSKDVGDTFTSNPDLASQLRAEGIHRLVVVGLQTDYCVRASILGAVASGFDVAKITLLSGAHSTYDNASSGNSYLQVKQDVEKQLRDLGVKVKPWTEFAV